MLRLCNQAWLARYTRRQVQSLVPQSVGAVPGVGHCQLKQDWHAEGQLLQSQKKYDCFPDLSGFKARQVRYLVPCFLEICKDQLVKGDDYTQHRMRRLQNLEGMYSCMEAHHLHMPKHAFQAFKKHTDLCLQHYSRCSTISIEKGFLQWNTIHKHHLTAHLPAQAEFINPRFVTTYSGETMVGLMASLAHTCLNGTVAFLVPKKVCWRFRLGMWLRLANNDGED